MDSRSRFNGSLTRREVLLGGAGALLYGGQQQARYLTMSAYPNILIVEGIRATGDYRSAVRDFLYSDAATGCQVRRGSHDFWITYVPPPAETGPNHAHMNETIRPRPMRGIVHMGGAPGDVSASTIAGQVGTLLQEVGHHWLVPDDWTVNMGGAQVPVVRDSSLVEALAEDRLPGGPLVIGRDNSHWSCWFQGGSSPMDGMEWSRSPYEAGYSRWVQTPARTVRVQPRGMGVPVDMWGAYNDLDLAFMGAKTQAEAYGESSNVFYWMEPRLTSPVNYHIGLCLEFAPNDIVQFGFYRDHNVLGIQRTGEQTAYTAPIGSDYHPLRDEMNAMMLRVVRRGRRYYFQACRGNSATAALTGRGPIMFDESDKPSDPVQQPTFDTWQTVGVYDFKGQPQAMGLMTRTTSAVLAEGQFFTFEVKHNGMVESMSLPSAIDSTGRFTPLADSESYRNERLYRHLPATGAWIRRRNFSMKIGVPYTGIFNHTQNVDMAPRLLARAPAGDFAFGTTAKVSRSIVWGGSGGAATGLTMLGRERSALVRDIQVQEPTRRRWLPPALNPPTLRMAFILVVPNRDAINSTMLQSLEVVRRYWNEGFRVATQGRYLSYCNLG